MYAIDIVWFPDPSCMGGAREEREGSSRVPRPHPLREARAPPGERSGDETRKKGSGE